MRKLFYLLLSLFAFSSVLRAAPPSMIIDPIHSNAIWKIDTSSRGVVAVDGGTINTTSAGIYVSSATLNSGTFLVKNSVAISSTTSGLLIAANTGRNFLEIVNAGYAIRISTYVTTNNAVGWSIAASATKTFDSMPNSGAVYAI